MVRSRTKGKKLLKGRRRGYRGKKSTFRYGRINRGTIYLSRKMPDMAISNSGVSGGAIVVDNPAANCITLGTITQSVGSLTGWDIPFSMKFRLQHLINYTDLTGICDKYKIAGAYVRVYYNKSGSAAGATAGMPYIQFITDHDDANVPTILTLKEKMGVKMKTFNNASSYIGMKCNPRPTREIYSTGIASAYELPEKAIWIDCTNFEVEHYGIKGVLQNVFLPGSNAQTEVFKFDVVLKIVGKDFQ